MADTNNERVGKTLALLGQGLGPFVDREAGACLRPVWRTPSKSLGSRQRPTSMSAPRHGGQLARRVRAHARPHGAQLCF